MKGLKKVITLALVIGIITSVFMPAAVNSNTNIVEKAEVLDELSILKGSESGYRLQELLKRSEAAAVIVRLLGKETYVMENMEEYSNTGFSDVKDSEWYAPYIGYCSKNKIISGFDDGTFGPNAIISDRAFLKLVLSALGYEYGEDFTWNGVFESAYNVGLVYDEEYITKEYDNIEYKREDAIEVVYNALMSYLKESDITLIERLIEQEVVQRDNALKLGLVQDSVQAQITSVSVSDMNRIVIEFNEDINYLTEDQITIYDLVDSTNMLELSIESQSDGELILSTSNQKPGTEYYLQITDAVDIEGNRYDYLDASFEGYTQDVVQSDFFKISKVEPISSKSIKIYFTHPVNVNSEIPSYYSIYEDYYEFIEGNSQSISVTVSGGENNAVILYLNNKSFVEDTLYTLNIDGNLTSSYGANLEEGTGGSIRFYAVEGEEKGFELESIDVIDTNRCALLFSKEVNPVLAKQVFNYYITDEDGDPIKIKEAVLTGDGNRHGNMIALTIEDSFDKDEDYKIMINNLSDVTRKFYITEKEYDFSGKHTSSIDLKLNYAVAVDEQTMVVSFNQPLNEETAKIVEYYTLIDISSTEYIGRPAKVYFNPEDDSRVVKLYFGGDVRLRYKSKYKLVVSGNIQGGFLKTSSNSLEYSFMGINAKFTNPKITKANIVSGDSIKVSFNKEIAFDAVNMSPSNYTLKYTDGYGTIEKIPVSIIYIDETTLILRFDTLDLNTEYTLEAASITNYAEISGVYSSPTDKSIKLNATGDGSPLH